MDIQNHPKVNEGKDYEDWKVEGTYSEDGNH